MTKEKFSNRREKGSVVTAVLAILLVAVLAGVAAHEYVRQNSAQIKEQYKDNQWLEDQVNILVQIMTPKEQLEKLTTLSNEITTKDGLISALNTTIKEIADKVTKLETEINTAKQKQYSAESGLQEANLTLAEKRAVIISLQSIIVSLNKLVDLVQSTGDKIAARQFKELTGQLNSCIDTYNELQKALNIQITQLGTGTK
jgi:chromosome segregation ATPase